MSEATDLRQVMKTVVPRPLRRALWGLDLWLHNTQQRIFERTLGVSTSGHLDHDNGLTTATMIYEGCEWIPVHRVLRSLRPGPQDMFVDIGSGKGQSLFIAARLPYGRVRGVELVESLVADAEANLRKAAPKLRCRDVATECADALEWNVPDAVSTLFLYSPFAGEVFREALERVFESYDRNPRTLRIVYVFPWEHNWLISSGRVVLEDVRPAQWPAKPWWWRSAWVVLVYRVVGPGEGGPVVPDVRRRLFRPRRAVQRWSAPNDQRFRIVRDGEELTSNP